MELKEGASVYNQDEKEVGKIDRIVMNPVTKEVTHIVIRKGLIFPEDKVVPIDWIRWSDADRVRLSASAEQIESLPPFEETHYVRLDDQERSSLANTPFYYMPATYYYPPYGVATGGGVSFAPVNHPVNRPATVERNIPDNTISLKEGADVMSAENDHIGDVERVFTDPNTNQVSHFIISQGLLLKEKKLVPMDWVRSMREDKVQLAVGEKVIEGLPEYKE